MDLHSGTPKRFFRKQSMLISEIGNAHFGDFNLAKQMIEMSAEAGADAVKFQAINPDEFSGGSMPREFYKACAFSEEQYMELIEYSRIKCGLNNCFFSVFSKSPVFEKLKVKQWLLKISGGQTEELLNDIPELMKYDRADVIMSVKESSVEKIPLMKKAQLLYVSPYLVEDPHLDNIHRLVKKSGVKAIGYSDHTRGIDSVVEAIDGFGCRVIEKHFTDDKFKKWNGIEFRDIQHSANKSDLKEISKRMIR